MKIIITFICIVFCASIFAQPARPVLPDSYARGAKEDYQKDRDLVEKSLLWLCKTPINEDIAYRSEVNYFVMEWLAGSPEIILNINTDYAPFINEHEELMFSLIHGMALYALNHKSPYDENKIHLKGLEVVCNMVETSDRLSEDKNLRKLVRARKKNRLKEFVSKEYLQTKEESNK